MPAVSSFVRTDADGAMRVGNSSISLDSIVAGFLRGDSPESIQQSYPAVSLEEVYGAITYYLGHRDEVGRYLRHQNVRWSELENEADTDSADVVLRLRALQSTRREMP